MEKEEIRSKIEEAKQLVGGDPQDPLSQIAFGEVLRMLLQQPSARAISERDATTALPVQRMRISEFLAQRKIQSETDRVAAVLYHSLHNGQNSSTRAEILEAYSSARTPKPKNLSDVIARCIRKGHVVEASEQKEEKKAWQITPSGERYVEEELNP